MRILEVENFSCIVKASMEIDRLTIIIGPQASGKSVIGKLCYFAIDLGLSQFSHIQKQDTLEKFTQAAKERFIEWFPISAWGSKKFKISFTAGEYSISLTRKSYRGANADDCRIKFSDGFQTAYHESVAQVQKQDSLKKTPDMEQEFERDWQIRKIVAENFKRLMGKDSVQSQAFVPAGRSFFTSVGKAIAAFEQGRVLDPLILRFGRMYSVLKDRPQRYFDHRATDKELRRSIDNIMVTLLGGRIQRDGDKEYLESTDGRHIPISALSSGQQELLPIIAFLPWFSGGREGALCYIEEPEAHLFPSTQSRLVQALVMAASGSSLVVTTHSPYVVTKINNLLKAGSLGRKQNDILRKDVDLLIPRKAWLSARTVRAYAICEGVMKPILGTDGLIDADYLDEISSDLSTEFSSLLELEERYA